MLWFHLGNPGVSPILTVFFFFFSPDLSKKDMLPKKDVWVWKVQWLRALWFLPFMFIRFDLQLCNSHKSPQEGETLLCLLDSICNGVMNDRNRSAVFIRSTRRRERASLSERLLSAPWQHWRLLMTDATTCADDRHTTGHISANKPITCGNWVSFNFSVSNFGHKVDFFCKMISRRFMFCYIFHWRIVLLNCHHSRARQCNFYGVCKLNVV